MDNARLEILADGTQLNLYGSIDYTTVPGLWRQLQDTIQHSSGLQISLQHVDNVNSAALALLLEAKQFAEQKAINLTFIDIPASLQNLASMSNVQDLL